MCGMVSEQALTKSIPEVELQRAKNSALSTVLSSLESRNVVSEDIGRQTLTYGTRSLCHPSSSPVAVVPTVCSCQS